MFQSRVLYQVQVTFKDDLYWVVLLPHTVALVQSKA